MTVQRVTPGWTGSQDVAGDDMIGKTGTIDLINILNAIEIPIVVVQRNFRVAYFNKAAADALGLSSSDIGRECHDVRALAGLSRLKQQCRETEMLAGGHEFQPVEVDNVFTARGRRTLILNACPLSFPGQSDSKVLVTFQDITAHKRTEVARDLRSEEELRRSEIFLAEGQRLSLTGSFSWKIATNEITWSEQLYRIYELESGIPVTLELIRTRVHPEDVALLEKMIEQSRNGTNDFEWQYRLIMPDHSIKYLHAVAHAIRHRDGQLEYIAAVQDVTQRTLSEQALSQARTELARASRLKSIGVMTASIAHELNQPLSGIITNASTCLRMLSAEAPNVDGARETARRTIRDANRASDLIMRLRALFARKRSQAESVDLNEATREVVALSSSELQKNRVILQTELSEDLPLVLGDRLQLQQVILNLLRNGIDAMRAVDDRPRLLSISTELEEYDWVRLSVQDAGVGFDLPHADRLFEAFYTTKDDGMGIGLSVSRSIIESHQGRLWAKLNDGPGATFAFSIPCRLEMTTSVASAA